LLAAVPAHDDAAALVRRALPDPEQRVHAELFHGRNVEHLDRNAKLLQALRPARELLRAEDVGRLVDEIARQGHAIPHGHARRIRLLDLPYARALNRYAPLFPLLHSLLRLGLAAIAR